LFKLWLKVMDDDDSDGVCGAPCLLYSSASDSDGVLGPAAPAPSQVRRRVRRRTCPPEIPAGGFFSAWLVTKRDPATSSRAAEPPSFLGAAVPQDVFVWGLARCEWLVERNQDEPVEASRGPAAADQGSSGVSAHLKYIARECWMFAHSHKIARFEMPNLLNHLDLRVFCSDARMETGMAVLGFFEQASESFENILTLPPDFDGRAVRDCPVTVDVFDLSRRMPVGRGCAAHPTSSTIAKWREKLGIGRRRAAVVEEPKEVDQFTDTLLALPKKARTQRVEDWSKKAGPARLKRQSDPCKVVDALEFAACLKQTDFFESDATQSPV